VNRDSAVCITTGWTADGSEFGFLYGQDLSFLRVVHSKSGAPLSNRYWGSFPGSNEADHPPTSAEVKNTWVCASTPSCVFMAWCLFKHRNKSAFYFSMFRCSSGFRELKWLAYETCWCPKTEVCSCSWYQGQSSSPDLNSALNFYVSVLRPSLGWK
jgi:hypothetical protein